MRSTAIRTSLLALVLAMGLVVAACGDGAAPQVQAQDVDGPTPDNSNSSSIGDTMDSPDLTSVFVTTIVYPTGGPDPTVVLEPVTTTTLPEVSSEESEDPFGPLAGEEIGVIGVAFDDVLNMRAGPAPDQAVVATLDPLATAIGTGRHRFLESGAIWWEISAGDTTGWAHSAFLSRLGEPVDLSGIDTSLTAATLLEIGQMVVESYMSPLDQAAVPSTVTVTLAPRGEHDLGEVVLDVTGFGDDSLSGMRFHVYARPTDDRQSFQLLRVEAIPMCWRGVYNGVCA